MAVAAGRAASGEKSWKQSEEDKKEEKLSLCWLNLM